MSKWFKRYRWPIGGQEELWREVEAGRMNPPFFKALNILPGDKAILWKGKWVETYWWRRKKFWQSDNKAAVVRRWG